MARYTVPKVYYSTSIGSTGTQIMRIKSLSWANRMNDEDSFTIEVPGTESALSMGGYIHLTPGDTKMLIQKVEHISDEKGLEWYKVSGKTESQLKEKQIDAKNDGYYYRMRWTGGGSFSLQDRRRPSENQATIYSQDIIKSSVYSDNLGGYVETYTYEDEQVIELREQTGVAMTWGTVIQSEPAVSTRSETRQCACTWFLPPYSVIGGSDYGTAGQMHTDYVTYTTSGNPVPSGSVTSISRGSASGAGQMRYKQSRYGWITADNTSDVLLTGPSHSYVLTGRSFTVSGKGVGQRRTVSIRGTSQMQSLMNGEFTSADSGSQSAQFTTREEIISTTKTGTTRVTGGHSGYSFTIKSRGEVSGPMYKVNFNLGDTITVSDQRLNVSYRGVVTGGIETIDSSGYNLEIEIGSLGATLEKRIARVI